MRLDRQDLMKDDERILGDVFRQQEEENIRGEESFLLLVCQRAWGEHDRHGKVIRPYPTGHRLCCRAGRTANKRRKI